MPPLLLAIVLGATSLQPLTTGVAEACAQSCERHVPLSEVPKVCAPCLKGNGVAAWMDAYSSQRMPARMIDSALEDPRWEVRWGALLARSRSRREEPSLTLADHIRRQPAGSRRVDACVVAAGAGALLEGQVLKTARRSCRAVREAVREAIEPQLYHPLPSVQEDALRQLMLLLEEGAGRVVLSAIRDRPETVDEVPAALLLRVSTSDYPVGKILLQDARPDAAREVNRLLAVFARQIDVLRTKLKAPAREQRLEAVTALGLLLPLSEPELEGCLSAVETGVEYSAAWALAEANDRGLREELLARVPSWEQGGVPVPTQLRWVGLLAMGRPDGCGAVLEALADNPRLSPEVRGSALGQLGRCGEGTPMSRILLAAEDPEEAVRAGAIRALADLPSNRAAAELAAQALQDPSPRVLAEALRAISTQSSHAVERAPEFMVHPAVEVRKVAAKMLAGHARLAHLQLIKDRVTLEPEAEIRVELVRALAQIGGPVATATLAELQASDPDPYVRQRAVSALKQLGFRR